MAAVTDAREQEPASGAYWDGVVEGWEPTFAHRLWRAHSDAVNGALLRRWLPGASRRLLKTDLFDEAVARGLYPELTAGAAEVTGIDLSPTAVRAASERYPALDARTADVLALPFADGYFDAVVSNSTLDHFASHSTLHEAVAELARVMAPGGTLIITLDNRSNPIVALRTSRLFGPLHRAGVVPYYVGATHGSRGLAALLRASGFDVGATAAIMHCPPQLAAHLAASRRGSLPEEQAEARHLRAVLRYEAMGRWPTRSVTAHFAAARAVKR
jgi:SAM-dependent methyltransferase